MATKANDELVLALAKIEEAKEEMAKARQLLREHLASATMAERETKQRAA
jgi:hypothetical protein